jgi:N-acetylglucosamine kinase-like BadF-type ATPase
MILITDGGSTKCDWIAIDDTGKRSCRKNQNKGLNPAILTEEKLKKIISGSEELMRYKSEVTHIFFYGAGCGTEKPRTMLTHVLQFLFLNAILRFRKILWRL